MTAFISLSSLSRIATPFTSRFSLHTCFEVLSSAPTSLFTCPCVLSSVFIEYVIFPSVFLALLCNLWLLQFSIHLFSPAVVSQVLNMSCLTPVLPPRLCIPFTFTLALWHVSFSPVHLSLSGVYPVQVTPPLSALCSSKKTLLFSYVAFLYASHISIFLFACPWISLQLAWFFTLVPLSVSLAFSSSFSFLFVSEGEEWREVWVRRKKYDKEWEMKERSNERRFKD